MSRPDNRFLSLPLILQTPVDKTIVAGGGFSDVTQIESPNPDRDTRHLWPLIGGRYDVPPVNNQTASIVALLQDTDAAVLLLVHFGKIEVRKSR